MLYIFAFFIDALVSGFILWLAARVTAVDLEIKSAWVAVVCASFASLIPEIGWLLSFIVFFILLHRLTSVSLWPDLILMVIVSKLFSIILVASLWTV